MQDAQGGAVALAGCAVLRRAGAVRASRCGLGLGFLAGKELLAGQRLLVGKELLVVQRLLVGKGLGESLHHACELSDV